MSNSASPHEKPIRNYIPTTPKTHMKPKDTIETLQQTPKIQSNPHNKIKPNKTPHPTPKIQSNPHNTIKPKIQKNPP